MWARISEIIIGGWLLIAPFVFNIPLKDDWIAAFLIITIALLSFIRKISKVHLLQVIPASWLIYLGYSYETPFLPFYLQSDILTAFLLLLFTVIPCHASKHPRPWEEFLKQNPDL